MNGTVRQFNLRDEMSMQRLRMVDRLRDHYGIKDQRTLDVMAELPRHRFVPEAIKSQAYNDNALPISGGQTISQPYIVARMTELLALDGSEKVLEIGAGSGYQTAVLAKLARKIFAVERIASLANDAENRLRALGLRNFSMKIADGTEGWSTYMPFDALLVAAGGPIVPEPLVKQLRVGGTMVMPLGDDQKKQVLVRIVRTETGYTSEDFGPCSFVPLIGKHGWN